MTLVRVACRRQDSLTLRYRPWRLPLGEYSLPLRYQLAIQTGD
ncbi:hypothetical protein [Nostoc sp.]